MLTFPTRGSGAPGRYNLAGERAIGWPERAAHCQCRQPLVAEPGDTCVSCGRYPQGTISRTWKSRAVELRCG